MAEAVDVVTGVEWFENLPTDVDRRIATAVIAHAYRYRWAQGGWNGREHSRDFHATSHGYLAVYAIGSRAVGQQTPDSDYDLLIAHNLGFDSSSNGFQPSFMRDVDFSALPEDFDDRTEQHYVESGYKAAQEAERASRDAVNSDPVANTMLTAIACATEDYMLPSSYSGMLPASYQRGATGHKMMARYGGAEDRTPLDLVVYKGWHLTKREIEAAGEAEVDADDASAESNPFEPCDHRCKAAGFTEGSTVTTFENVIDTDEDGTPLIRVPLFTFSGGERTFYIPEEVEELIRDEHLVSGYPSHDYWSHRWPWEVTRG